MNKKTYIGQKFGMLTTIDLSFLKNDGKWKRSFVKCKCDYGNEVEVRLYSLKNGNTQSCGCKKINKLITHGLSKHRLYQIWEGMIQRCYNKKSIGYKNYGGRGIILCDEWKNDFQKFYDWAISYDWQEDLTIERIDNDGNYCPQNCKWATYKEQQNNRTNNHLVIAFGEEKTIADWSNDLRCKVCQNTLWYRITRYKWSTEKAITKPPYGEI